MPPHKHAPKPVTDTFVQSAGKVLQTHPFQPDVNTNQQAPQRQEEPEALTGGFDLTKIQYDSSPPPISPLGRPIQAKLTIGEPNDKYEKEADRVAHDVVQRIHETGGANDTHHPSDQPQTNSLFANPIHPLQRAAMREDEERLQTKALADMQRFAAGAGTAPTEVEQGINSARGGGKSLAPKLQAQMGQAMGADFSRVRVHTDARADQLNRSIQAKAFTNGQDIFFRQGVYQPGSRGGQELIAHELTHVVQQNGEFVQQKNIFKNTNSINTISCYSTRTADNPDMQEWVTNYQRSSTNGGILQISEQHIVASDEIIKTSEAALLAQNSAVELVKGKVFSPGYSRVKVQARKSRANTLRGDAPVEGIQQSSSQDGETNKLQHLAALDSFIESNETMIKTGHQVAARTETLKNMRAERQKLVATGDTDIFLTIRDCHMTSRLIMGDVGIGKLGNRKERMEVTDNTGANQSVEPKIADTNTQATTANRGAIGVLKASFKTFESVLVENGFGPQGSKTPKTEIIRDLHSVNAAWDYTAGMKLYKVIQSDSDVSSLFNRTFSINEYAKVAIGQALVIVNDESEKKAADEGNFDGGRELWNYHWAGVILMDGNDYVTLEAVADANATSLTTDWKFKMYGMIDRDASAEVQAQQAEQTFHGNQKTDTHTGTAPLTMGVSAR